MDYLPQRKRELPIQVIHKQEKVKKFRRYLADSNVVLAFVKYLLALRDCKPWPENPTDYLKDFFGNYRDPKWDDVEALEKNIEDIQSNQVPSLEAKIKDLEFKLKTQRKRNFLANCFKQLDADGSKLVGYKLLVMRLSGFPKFDLDTKLNSEQFVTFVMSLVGPERPIISEQAAPSEAGSQKKPEEQKEAADESQFSEEEIFNAFGRASKAETPFAGDLENPLYKFIIAKLRSFNPPVSPEPSQ